MEFNKSAVVIHAHPDDTEAFCSGTLKHLKDKGFSIAIATMTAGGMGGIGMSEQKTIAVRKKEAAKAAAVLDAPYHCFGGRDGYLFDTEALRVAVIDFVRKHKAGVVLTHLPFDYHSDHRTTAQIVEAAVMLASLPSVPCRAKPLEVTPLLYHTAPLGFSDPLGNPIAEPHFFVDITKTIDTKMDMLAHHHSQIELMRVMHKMPNFFDEMKKYNIDLGKIAGVKYAECFWQHLGGGFQKDPLLQRELADVIRKLKKIK
ncbi:MAG: PIG-L family deacetylase [Spirochaetes bacterium]|nr:PIG-L family deacetylase [Spirochaetota bacterium]